MIKFIIIDDEKHELERVEKIITNVIFQTETEYDVFKFTKYNSELENVINDNSITKVYIIDIELDKNKSGLDIARQIRENDWDSEIIIITNHDRMFETVYKTIYKVFNFIEKFDNMEARLEADLKTIIRKTDDKKKFIYKNNKISLQIYLKDILYIYRDTIERKLVIVTTNNKYLVNMTIINILKLLDKRFKQIHRACIVNNERVRLYNWNEGYFELDNAEQVFMLSKTFRKEDKNED